MQGFSSEMADEAQNKLKINKASNVFDILTKHFLLMVCNFQRQARRIYEILRFKATNLADAEEYRGYRLDVKRRLNIPYQV